MNDLIRRQDAINVIDDMFMEDERYKVWLKLDINNLPSAPMNAIPIEFIESKKEKMIEKRDKYEPKSFVWLNIQYDIDTLDELMFEWKKEEQNEQTGYRSNLGCD